MSRALSDLAWDAGELPAALDALAREAGIARPGPVTPGPAPAADGPALERWVDAEARARGLVAEPLRATREELGALVRGAAPCLLRLPPEDGFLALAAAGRRGVRLVTPGGGVARRGIAAVARAASGETVENGNPGASAAEEVDAILGAARLSSARAERCRAALLNRLQGGRSLDAGFLVRPAGGSLRDLAGEAGLARRLGVLLIACAARFALAILAWLCLGRGLFAGQTEEGWLLAFGLVLASALPFQWLAGAAAGELSLRAGALLRSRLLRGALRQDPEEVRHQGVGQLLGRVVESEAVEHMALAGGFLTLAAGLELAFAAAVLAAGAGGWFHVLALGLALVPAGRLALRYGRARGTWTDDRLALSADWIESLAGHRTRRIQGAGGAAEPDADGALEAYDARSRELDGIRARLVALVPRAWLALGLAGLAPAFLGGAAGPALAVGIGGVLLAYRALVGLGDGLHAVVGNAVPDGD